jgi:glutamine synthetase
MVPIAQFSKMLENGQTISISSVITHALRNDHIAKGVKATDAIHLIPDLLTASIPPLPSDSHRLEILAGFAQPDGVAIPECPRRKLKDLCQVLHDRYGYFILVGYEIEVVFFRPGEETCQGHSPQAPSSNHTWSSVTSDVRSLLPMVEKIVRSLAACGINIQQYHAESTPGQWEFVLPPAEPLKAVDVLVRAREAIALIAREHGYCATLHPRPYSDQAGTGAHVHLSVNSIFPDGREPSLSRTASSPNTDAFFAGIIDHFNSIMAFCLPLDVSYQRVVSGIWSGGEYVCWGRQNRETPLRRIDSNRFELKLHCGTANPYFSLASLLAAGLDGFERDLSLTTGDCQGVPAEMTEKQRAELGITVKISQSVGESLKCLRADTRLCQGLGTKYVAAYAAVTEEWNEYVSKMDPVDQRKWLLQNY